MAPSTGKRLGMWATLVILGGCCAPAFRSPSPSPDLPGVERGNILPDLNQLPPYPEVEAILLQTAHTFPPYRALLPGECQCRAAFSAGQADTLTREIKVQANRMTSPPLDFQGRQVCANFVKQAFLWNQSLEYRNRAAATALQGYYRLAQSEARWDLLQQSLAEVSVAYEQALQAQNQGLKTPVEPDKLRRQRIELQKDQVDLFVLIHQLNSQLQLVLDLDQCPNEWRFWPTGPFAVVPECLDIEAEVCKGMEKRPELISLRFLIRELDRETLPMALLVLTSNNPAMGVAQSPPSLRALVQGLMERALCLDPRGLEARRCQLIQLLQDRERFIAAEIREFAHAIEWQARQVVVARELSIKWLKKVNELEDRVQRGLALPAEVNAARLDWLKARGEEIEEVMSWHLLHVQLKQAQGVLTLECGYRPCSPCCSRKKEHNCVPPPVPCPHGWAPKVQAMGDAELPAQELPTELPPSSGPLPEAAPASAGGKFPAFPR